MLDLTLESPTYSMVPTSLVNPDIVLPHHEFRKHRGLPELPPGCGPEQREYFMDGARGLIDLDWSQRTLTFHPDDIDQDPRFNQYPYPDDDLDYDDDEEMETDYQNAPPGGAGDARVATPASAGCRYYRPPATYSLQTSQGQASGSPRSTHTDTDTAMKMGGLSMAPGGPDTHHVPPRAKAPPATYSLQTSQGQTSGSPRSTHTDTDTAMKMGGLSMAPRGPDTHHVPPSAKAPTAPGSMSTPELAATVARGVAAAATQILEQYARPPNEAECPPVDQAADAAL